LRCSAGHEWRTSSRRRRKRNGRGAAVQRGGVAAADEMPSPKDTQRRRPRQPLDWPWPRLPLSRSGRRERANRADATAVAPRRWRVAPSRNTMKLSAEALPGFVATALLRAPSTKIQEIRLREKRTIIDAITTPGPDIRIQTTTGGVSMCIMRGSPNVRSLKPAADNLRRIPRICLLSATSRSKMFEERKNRGLIPRF
jgi:hypothetical protein